MMASRMKRKFHVRFRAGENLKMTSKDYLSLYLYRNYGAIARDYYGYHIAVIDLRNPMSSDGNNMLHLVNKYMDLYKQDKTNIAIKAKTEKYAKIIAKTIIFSDGDTSSYGQNSFFL